MAVINTTLQLKVDVCESSNCRWLIFTETTGVYDPTTNPGGWEEPASTNPDWDEATSASLVVTTPDGDSYTFFDDPPFFWDEGGDFPTDDDSLKYVITAEMLGFDDGARIPDGIYKFVYTVAGVKGADTYTETVTCEKLVTCQLKCCIQKLEKEAAKDPCSDCKDSKVRAATLMRGKLLAAKSAAACGMKNRAAELMDEITWLCNNYNCSC